MGTTRHAGARTSRLPAGLIIAAAAVLAFAVQVVVLRRFVTDDAFISLRYARNFAAGHGPVWNPGGPAVEGFSNPAFVFAEALAFRLGVDGVLVARGLGVLAGLGLVAACWFLGRRVLGDTAAAVATVLTAASPALAYWSVSGLETLPMALLLTVACLELARADGGSPVRAALVLAALPWVRPEGLALAAALVFCSEIRGLLDPARRRATLRRLAWLGGLPVLSQVLLQALRLSLYDHLLPNSVLYKAGTGTLGQVTLKFLVENAPIVLLAVVGLAFIRGRTRLLAVPAVVYLTASLTFLNSVNLFSRLLLPTLPLWILVAAAGIARGPLGAPRHRTRSVVAATLVVAALMLVVMPARLPTAAATAEEYRTCKHTARREGGLWLRERLVPGDVYAVADAGVLPYFADGTAMDILGLNEAWLQDSGTLAAGVRADRMLTARPRFYVSSSASFDRHRPLYAVDRQVRRDDRFAQEYVLRTVTGTRGAGCKYFLHIFEATA